MPPLVLLSVLFSGTISAEGNTISDISLPEIGKWVLTDKGEPADWLGVKYQERTLYDLINIIVIDDISKSEEEAIHNLESNCKTIGYDKQFGHSSGYFGEINHKIFGQIPHEWRTAFANGPMWETNNHGRFFGPLKYNGVFVFSGSFSRESFRLFAWIHHYYESFRKSVNDFSEKAVSSNLYTLVGKINLENVLVDSPDHSTGDHDGLAMVLKTR